MGLTVTSKYAETYVKSHSVEEVMSGAVKFPSVIIGMLTRLSLVFLQSP